jgi:pilus assembly protein CpaB
MKAARLVVLSVALAAGGAAALLVGGGSDKKPAPPPPPAATLDTVDVLIAKSDIDMGTAVKPGDFQWQAWPAASTGSSHILRKERPNAIEELAGSITRVPFSAGEPIRDGKLIKANGSGFMAAILPSGMRAVSTEISPETGAGGFILPNDRVDVILSRRDKNADNHRNGDSSSTETILSNVRVLAIDQTVEEKGGQRVVVGKTATLELTPRQAETLALSRQLGILSLALRSLLDANKTAEISDDADRKGAINTVRYGVSSYTTSK